MTLEASLHQIQPGSRVCVCVTVVKAVNVTSWRTKSGKQPLGLTEQKADMT